MAGEQPKPKIKNQKRQGDHGGCRANYRCCIPALAGFVSPHSMGPGKSVLELKPHPARQQEQIWNQVQYTSR
jgi:hypothetical protein